jgi:60 kDa SS-A/Ro ribonucleoprotein
MTNYLRDAIATRIQTPQSESIPGRLDQITNSAGGYVFEIDDFGRLERFLVLGTEGGTYYATERDLTKESLTSVDRAINADGVRVVQMVTDISHSGRAPKNDPALLVLAMCAASKDLATRQAALAALPKVARIGTHLFHFAHFIQTYRGWGRGLRRAIGNWYLDRSTDNLINQVVKYRQRDGWSHRDMLRLSHPKTDNAEKRAVFEWVTHPDRPAPDMLAPAVALMVAKTAAEAVPLIRAHKLPREVVPTDLLNELSVWEALLEDMPMTAMIRNLGKMSNIGLLKPLSVAGRYVADRLADEALLQKARVHPIAILMAMKIYQQGHGDKGKMSWTAVSNIVDALDKAFYLSFKSVTPTGKRQLLAVDVSGSMSSPILGTPLSAREGAAAMALVMANVEKNSHIVGFASSNKSGHSNYGWGSSRTSVDDISGLVELDISPRQRLDTVVKYIANLPFGGTDCSLPMRYALKTGLDVDAFTVITDSETWAGPIHPTQALHNYRVGRNIPAKSVVVGMTATNFTIADPRDAGQMDVVGFDTAAPQLIADFIRD